MESYFQNNLALIKRIRPNLYIRLEPYLNDIKSQDIFDKLYEQSIEKEFQRSVEISKLKYPRILFFDGIGLGYHIFEFLKLSLNSVRNMVVIEKDPVIFLQALKIHDFSSLIEDSNFYFFVGLQFSEMVPALKRYFWEGFRLIYSDRCEHFYFYPSLKKDGEYYLNFSKSIKLAVEGLISTYVAPNEDSYRGLLNLSRNIKIFPNSISIHHFEKKFIGKPGIVIAAGPSLNQHLDFLKKNQDKFVLACSDGAARAVIKKGIKPHFIFSIERDLEIISLFNTIPADYDVPLVTLPIVHPKVYESYPGPVVMFPRECSFGRWIFNHVPQYELGLSSANMAYRALALAGCSKIYLLGQDLALDRRTQQTHTEEMSDIQKQFAGQVRELSIEIMGNDGTPIISNPYWKLYINDYESLIAQMGVPCINVIRKDQGAQIPGAILLEPELFWREVNLWENVNAHSKISEIIKSSPKLDGSVFGSYGDLLAHTINFFKKMERSCLEMMEEISLTYLENCPFLGSQHELDRYEKYFHLWNEKIEKIIDIDRSLFFVFLFSLFGSNYVRIFSAREALLRDDVLQYILRYISLTQEWLSTLHYWTRRSRRLLEQQKN